MSTKINDDSMSLEIDALEVPDFLAGDRDARREALAAALKDLVRAPGSRCRHSAFRGRGARRVPCAKSADLRVR